MVNTVLFSGARRSSAPGDVFMPAIPCGLYYLRVPDGITEEIKVWRTRDHKKRQPGRYLISVKIGESSRDHEAQAIIKHDGSISFIRARPDPKMRELVEMFFLLALRLNPPEESTVSAEDEFGSYCLRLIRPACARCGRTLEGSDVRAWISEGCAIKWSGK